MHRPSLARLALSALIGAVGALVQPGDERFITSDDRRPRGWRNPCKSIVSANRFRPHQGTRESARRRGGAAWIGYRNACRARRGLHAINR